MSKWDWEPRDDILGYVIRHPNGDMVDAHVLCGYLNQLEISLDTDAVDYYYAKANRLEAENERFRELLGEALLYLNQLEVENDSLKERIKALEQNTSKSVLRRIDVLQEQDDE